MFGKLLLLSLPFLWAVVLVDPPRAFAGETKQLGQLKDFQELLGREPHYKPFGPVLQGDPPLSPLCPDGECRGFPARSILKLRRGEELGKLRVRLLQRIRGRMELQPRNVQRVLPFHGLPSPNRRRDLQALSFSITLQKR